MTVILALACVISAIAAIAAVVVLVQSGPPRDQELRVARPQSPAPLSVPPGQMPMLFTGPDRYCPTCGRLLVHVNEDGGFDLSGNAGLSAVAEMEVVDGVPQRSELEALVVEAVCLTCNPEEK